MHAIEARGCDTAFLEDYMAYVLRSLPSSGCATQNPGNALEGGTKQMKTQPLEGLGRSILFIRVGAPRSLRIAFGGRLVRVGSPRSLRIAFGGRVARVSAPRPSQQGYMCTQHVLTTARAIYGKNTSNFCANPTFTKKILLRRSPNKPLRSRERR
jgi:hypothetical protein